MLVGAGLYGQRHCPRQNGSNGCVSSDGVSCEDVSNDEELNGVGAEDSDPETRPRIQLDDTTKVG